MGFGNQPSHILQPIIDQIAVETKDGSKPRKCLLLELARKLVAFGYNPCQPFPSYSSKEKAVAKELLKTNNFGHLANCSPSFRDRTLILIEAELKILSSEREAFSIV